MDVQLRGHNILHREYFQVRAEETGPARSTRRSSRVSLAPNASRQCNAAESDASANTYCSADASLLVVAPSAHTSPIRKTSLLG